MVGLSGCGEAIKQLTTVKLTAQSSTVAKAWLDEQWYGYWALSDSTGDWECINGSWWDCCAEVNVSGSELKLTIWDEDMSKSDYLAELQLEKSGDGYSCTGGEFLGTAIENGQAALTLSESSGTLLTISGKYEDSETGDFYYSFYMRPWGDTWPDSGRTPRYYQDWYLPLIQSDGSAPDEINIK